MFIGIMDPEELGVICGALDAFVEATGTIRGSVEHEEAGIRVLALYQNKATSIEVLTSILIAEWFAKQPIHANQTFRH
jgi:hypothetical protein